MRPLSDDDPCQSGPQARSSLVNRTQLVHGSGGVVVSVWPDAFEAIVAAVPEQQGGSADFDFDADEVSTPAELSVEDQAERQQLNWNRATRRAFSESRRYLVANRLRYMWVFTMAGHGLHGSAGRAEIMKLMADFIRRLRRVYGDLPYWFSPELHPGGHGWHVNLFLGRRVPHARMKLLWGFGRVNVSDWAKNSRVKKLGLSLVDAIRMGALYGCKYAAKDWDPEQIGPNGRRYSAAEGYKPRKLSVRVESLAEGVGRVEQFFGGPPSSIWHSTDCAHWDGPTVVAMRYSIERSGHAGDG